MKTNKTILAAITIITMLLFTASCSKTFYTEANINPNSPTQVPPSTLLTGIEGTLAYTQGGPSARYTQMFMQQGYGTAIEVNGFYYYQVSSTNLPNALWGDIYDDVMEDDYILLNSANSNGYNRYAGIANILMAYSLQVNVDLWGDIPYSQAFLGNANIEPAYDNAQVLYGNMITLLNTGIADLNKAPGALIPTTDDILSASSTGGGYNGNSKSWIAFAYALEARVYLHQTKNNNAAMCNAAIAAADSAISNGFEGAEVIFPGGSASNANPVQQFNSTWAAIDYVTSSSGDVTLFDTMLHFADPRIPKYFDTAGYAANNLSGSDGIGMDASTYYGQTTSPVELITLEEVYLIKAEANVRLGTVSAVAQTAYAAAINANFTKLGLSAVSTAAYMAGPQGTLPSNVNGALYQIGRQAWETYFLNPEAWTSWRRTGAPALQSTVAGEAIPRRMPLPVTETANNGNAPKGETLWIPQIFWDN